MTISLNADVAVTFNDTKIINITNNMNCNMDMVMPSANFNDDGDIIGMTICKIPLKMTSGQDLDLDIALNSNLINPASYVDTDSVVENKAMRFDCYIDGAHAFGKDFQYSDTLTAFTHDIFTVPEWYLDEECTQPFSALNMTTAPSCDVKLYAKSSTVTVTEGDAILIAHFYDEFDEFMHSSMLLMQSASATQDITGFLEYSDYIITDLELDGIACSPSQREFDFSENKVYVLDVTLTEV